MPTFPTRALARGATALAATLSLAACSADAGDGDAGEQPVVFTFRPAELVGAFQQGDRVLEVPVEIELSRLPSDVVYVTLIDPAGALDFSRLTSVAGTVATVDLRPSCLLEPGLREGSLVWVLCADEGCERQYPVSGNVLPYRFTVSNGPVLRVAVDGVWQVGYAASACAHTSAPGVTAGQIVTVESGIPVAWDHRVSFGSGLPTVTVLEITDTTWTAQIGLDPPTGVVGGVTVEASPLQPGTVVPRVSTSFGVFGW